MQFRFLVGLVAALLSVGVASFSARASEAPVALEEHRNYRILDEAAPAPADRVQVILFYRYADPAMRDIMPAWDAWRRDHGPLVILAGTPGVLQDEDGTGARVFFALDRLGFADELAPRIVSAAAVGAVDPVDFSSWGRWLGEQGIKAAALAQAVNDPLLREQTGHIPQVMQMYGVSSLPAVVVAGRYLVDTTLVQPKDLIPTAKAIATRLQVPR